MEEVRPGLIRRTVTLVRFHARDGTLLTLVNARGSHRLLAPSKGPTR
jgi:hypothetical protein